MQSIILIDLSDRQFTYVTCVVSYQFFRILKNTYYRGEVKGTV
jgi:hypothetical protein